MRVVVEVRVRRSFHGQRSILCVDEFQVLINQLLVEGGNRFLVCLFAFVVLGMKGQVFTSLTKVGRFRLREAHVLGFVHHLEDFGSFLCGKTRIIRDNPFFI